MATCTQIDLKGQGLVILKGLTIVVDPKDDKVKDKDRETTRNSAPTKDKHRFTVCAPTDDESVFSVGKGASGPIAKTGLQHIKDSGITGRTKSHVHFETTGGTACQTVLSLGEGSKDSALVCTFDGAYPVPRCSSGYGMVTAGESCNIAEHWYYIASLQDDVQIRAVKANVNVEATEQSVGIDAGKNVSITARGGSATIGAETSIDPKNPQLNVAIESAVGKALSDKHLKQQMKALDVARGVFSFSQKFQVPGYAAVFGSKGWKGMSWPDAAKVGVDTMKLVSTMGRMALKHWDTQGKVGVTGETYASVTGGVATSIYGGLSASITSLLSASMLGIASAGIKGIGWASVWSGIGTSIKSLKDVSVEGQLGKAKLKAKQDVSVESRAGKVNVTGDAGVQLNAPNGIALVHSPDMVVCMAGNDAGTAIAADENIIMLGLVDSGARSFETAKVNREKAVVVNKKGILTRFGNAEIELKEDGVYMSLTKKNGVKVDGEDVNVWAKGKILVG